MRNAFAAQVVDRTAAILDRWKADLALSHRFHRGWNPDYELSALLKQRIEVDSDRGFTSVGPQRADWVFLSDQSAAEKTLSRGQQKLLVLALNIAVLDIIGETRGKECRPVLLIDDLGSELDRINRSLIVETLVAREVQTFIAMIEIDDSTRQKSRSKVFHVEQGALK
jgi:DNA replication and repair protein RecF